MPSCSAGLEDLVPEEGMLSIELELKTAPWLLWIPCASESTGKEGNYYASLVTDSYCCGEIGPLLHDGGKEEYWNAGDPLGHLLVLLYPVIGVNGKLPLYPGRTTNGPDPLRIMVWATLPGKKTGPAGVPAEVKGNMEWMVREGSYKYWL